MALQLPPTGSHPQDFDKATQSNYQEIKVTHTHLEWTIDWEKQVFHGHAVVSLQAQPSSQGVERVVLDTSFLDIKKIEIDGTEVKWHLGERIGTIGSALSFDLPRKVNPGEVSYLICVAWLSRPPLTFSDLLSSSCHALNLPGGQGQGDLLYHSAMHRGRMARPRPDKIGQIPLPLLPISGCKCSDRPSLCDLPG
jgi:hypothetical protein